MLREEKDYLLRLINQASIAMARLRERLVGGTNPGEIVQAARDAQGELLGRNYTMLRALDPASAMHVVGDRATLRAWAELLQLEADALREAGQTVEASALDTRVHTLRTNSEP